MPKKSSDDVEQYNTDDSEDDDEIEKEEESDDEEYGSNDQDDDDDDDEDDSDVDDDEDGDDDDDDDDESDKDEEKDDDDDDSDKEEEEEEEEEDEEEDDSEDDSDEEDDNDDDFYDSEKGEKPEEFEDEEAFIEHNSSGDTPYGGHPDFGEQEKFSDDETEIENNDRWWEGSEKIIGIIMISCCCLCLIIIGVVVGVVVAGGGNNNGVVDEGNGSDRITAPVVTPRPTLAPQPLPPSARPPPTQKPTESPAPTMRTTLSPTQNPTKRPTAGPTASPAPTMSIPNILAIVADQDTYVNLDGEFQGEEYGDMDTFLVQRGPFFQDETSLPSAVALVSFPFDDLPSFGRLNDAQTNAVLRLTHLVSTAERGPATYTIVRIPESRMYLEYLHGYSFLPPQDDVDGVKVGPSFEVNPGDTIVDIDITPLLFDYELEPGSEPDQLLLMIQKRGAEQEQGGDRFYSRETNTPPQLLMDFVGGNAADIITSEEPEVALVDGVNIDFEDSDNTTENEIGTGDGRRS